MQPRYGLIVQSNGIRVEPGTLFSADLASTSWNVMPWNSGVVTLRTSPRIDHRPGNVPGLPPHRSRCPAHRMD